ncbi:MAG: phenylalanine--tRNA ligase subunit beta [Kiritimatiellae bacterium]|nr:phenylalanine--tRNA ligase subunit beta [Kiritimatiellia bacterium]
MKTPISWLKEYVDFDDSTEGLAEKLTFSGIEVEAIDQVDSESVLDLEITPNRPDCLSMMGMAREIAGLYRTTLKRPNTAFKESLEKTEILTCVDVQDTEGCPRYTARMINNINVGPSPDWMQKRLQLSDIRPINNVVDITNYVLLECGQPLHAFDHRLLHEGRIIVRRAKPKETLKTLDQNEYTLSANTLVTADAQYPTAMAGVMGGARSEIRETTQTILLESASFKASDVHSASKQFRVSSESSYRFERGVDIENVEWASRRAASLIEKYASGSVTQGVVDVYPHPVQPKEISCRWKKVCSLIGLELTEKQIQTALECLELEVIEANHEFCKVRVPSFRLDLEREVDLIEEIARTHGLDKIPSPPPRTQIIPAANDQRTRALFQLRHHLVSLGLQETMNYSLVSALLLDLFDPDKRDPRTVLPLPISVDQSVLRTSLIPQMVTTIGHNFSRQVREGLFFEIGRTYMNHKDKQTAEEEHVAIGLLGPVGRSKTNKRKPITNDEAFLWLKGIIESLLEKQGFDSWSFEKVDRPFFEPGQGTKIIVEKEPAGILGILHQTIRKKWRLETPIPVSELKAEILLKHFQKVKEVKTPTPYPPACRDISIISDKRVRHSEIIDTIKKCAPKDLENAELFDIFEDTGIGDNKKSMAYSLIYRSSNRSLTDEEVNACHTTVKDAIRKNLEVEIRES